MPAYEEPPVLPGGSFLRYARSYVLDERVIVAAAVQDGETQRDEHYGDARGDADNVHFAKFAAHVPGALFVFAEAAQHHGVGDGLNALHRRQHQRDEDAAGCLETPDERRFCSSPCRPSNITSSAGWKRRKT